MLFENCICDCEVIINAKLNQSVTSLVPSSHTISPNYVTNVVVAICFFHLSIPNSHDYSDLSVRDFIDSCLQRAAEVMHVLLSYIGRCIHLNEAQCT